MTRTPTGSTPQAISEEITKLARAGVPKLSALFTDDTLGVAYWQGNGLITEANEAFLNITGYSREDLAAGELSCETLTAPEFHAQDHRIRREMLRTGLVRQHRKEYLRKDGQRVAVMVMGAKFPGTDGGYSICQRTNPAPSLNSDTAQGGWFDPLIVPPSAESPSTSDSSETFPAQFLRGAATGCAVLAIVLAALALSGWVLDLLPLASLHPDYIPMAPATAFAFVSLGAGLLLSLRDPSSRPPLRHLRSACALAVLVMSTGVLLNLVLGQPLDFERTLVPNPERFGEVPTGRISPFTVLGLLSLSLCLFFTNGSTHWKRETAGYLGTFALLLSSLVMLGYFYGAPLLYGGFVIPMALSTALCLMLLSLAALAVNGADYFPLRAVSGNSTRALLLRTFLPVAPVVVATHALFYRVLPVANPALHSAMLVVLSTVVILLTILQAAKLIAAKMDRVELRRRHAEQALQSYAHALERQAGLLDLAHAAIIVRDLKQIIRFWNRGAEEIFGYSREHALGRSIVELLKPSYQQPPGELERQFMEQGTWQGEITYFDAEGRPRVMDSRWTYEHDFAGNADGVLEINNDITERKQAENDLRVQLKRNTLLNQVARSIGERQDLASILNIVLQHTEESLALEFSCISLFSRESDQLSLSVAGPGSHWTSDLLQKPFPDEASIGALVSPGCHSGEIVYWRDAARETSPLSARYSAAGFHSLVFIPLIVASRVLGIMVAARRAPEAFSESEEAFLRQLCEHVALAVQDGQLYQDLVRAYEELRKTQESVLQQERLRALGQMASGITHDINNALSPIVGYADLLLCTETDLAPDSRKHLETIVTAAGDIAEIIARLRQFYKPPEEAGRMSLAAPNALVEQAINLTRPRWKDAMEEAGIGVQVLKQLQADLPLIMCVESEMREALVNLIINALDAMPIGGTLAFKTYQRLERVVIEISDTGIGMDEDTHRRCFEPFFTTKGEQGTGLGLGMVYGIVQRHLGDIGIESERGIGTTIRLSFKVPHLHDGSPADGTQRRALSHLHILVVDDEPLLRQLVSEMLRKDDHVVDIAESGQLALLKFEAAMQEDAPFDLVITDLGMPDVSGRRVAKAVKNLMPETPVILLTGWGARMLAEGDVPPEVDTILTKPPRLDTLRDAIAEVMEKKHSKT